jgi:hypothetical protein
MSFLASFVPSGQEKSFDHYLSVSFDKFEASTCKHVAEYLLDSLEVNWTMTDLPNNVTFMVDDVYHFNRVQTVINTMYPSTVGHISFSFFPKGG